MDDDAAPPAARLIRDFVNTREPQTGVEELQHPEDLQHWIDAHVPASPAPGPSTPGPSAPALDDSDLAVARQVREGLRAILLAHAGHETPTTALTDLDSALARVPVRVHLSPQGTRLLPGDDSPLALALTPLVDAVRECAQDASWQRLKACSRESCHWVYYDGSRNQSRRWCSMAGCGNYVKMRRRNASPTHPVLATGDLRTKQPTASN